MILLSIIEIDNFYNFLHHYLRAAVKMENLEYWNILFFFTTCYIILFPSTITLMIFQYSTIPLFQLNKNLSKYKFFEYFFLLLHCIIHIHKSRVLQVSFSGNFVNFTSGLTRFLQSYFYKRHLNFVYKKVIAMTYTL